MTATIANNSVTFTADDETYTGMVLVTGMSFQGSGLTIGQRLRVTDGNGTILCDYLVEAATDNADLWGGRDPVFADGIVVEDGPAAGTWVLTVMFG